MESKQTHANTQLNKRLDALERAARLLDLATEDNNKLRLKLKSLETLTREIASAYGNRLDDLEEALKIQFEELDERKSEEDFFKLKQKWRQAEEGVE